MKKLLALLLAGSMLFGFAACGDDSEEKEKSKENKYDTVEDGGDIGGENGGDFDSNYGDFDTEEEINVNVGDYITFGKYEQDNDISNGKEDIEWLVLDKEGDKVLVISKYGLDCKPYNDEKADVTWETCTLRSWLNDEFINEAFSSSELSQIPTVTVTAGANPDFRTNPGHETQDKLFILCWDEAFEYFSYVGARCCAPTDYAIAQGAWVGDKEDNNGNCWWWLRSPGSSQNLATRIIGDGTGTRSGLRVNALTGCIRPAMWIEL